MRKLPPIVAALLVMSGSLVAAQQRGRVSARVGVPMGYLMLDGGPEASPIVAKRFVELAGGPAAKIAVVPTAMGDQSAKDPATLEKYRALFGAGCCVIVHAMDRATADRADFAATLNGVTGVWMTGGSTAVLSDVYWQTATERAFRALLDRGGVVGGSSAGALIQGSRIHTPRPNNAFAFLRNTVVWPHLNRPGVPNMLVAEIMANPKWIGVGISENTAAIVRGDDLEVVGEGTVIVGDGKMHSNVPYVTLRAGDRFTLKPR